MSRAFDLLVEMNPVPDPDLLVVPEEEWHEAPPLRPLLRQTPGWGRGWLAAAAAALAVTVVTAGIWLLGIGGGDQDVADADTTLAERTETLFASFSAGDYAAFRRPFLEDVSLSAVSGWRFLTAAVDWPPNVAPADFGFRVVAECAEQRPDVVRCELTQRGDVFERMGVTIPGTAMVFYDDEGAVYAMNLDSHLQVDAVSILDEFAAWLRSTHGDVFDATFDAFSDEQIPPNGVDTVDNRSEWTALVGEFLEDRSGG